MKYRGLDPRTRPLRWGLFLIIVAIALVVTGSDSLQAAANALGVERARLPWYATRVLALLSYLAISGSVAYGLLLSTGILDALAHRAVSFTLHQDLASVGLGLALVHASLLMLDKSVPYTPAEVLVPFLGPYRPLWVGIGQLTLYLTIVVIASFYLRRRIGQRTWRLLHYLTLFAFVGATAHGLMSGTDTSALWAFLGYLTISTTVAFLFGYRIVKGIGTSRSRKSAPGPRMSASSRNQVAAD
jgi:methionine sulfoxide reductase heme-binding subunit